MHHRLVYADTIQNVATAYHSCLPLLFVSYNYVFCATDVFKKSVDLYRLLKVAGVKNRVPLKAAFYLTYAVRKLLTYTSSTY